MVNQVSLAMGLTGNVDAACEDPPGKAVWGTQGWCGEEQGKGGGRNTSQLPYSGP